MVCMASASWQRKEHLKTGFLNNSILLVISSHFYEFAARRIIDAIAGTFVQIGTLPYRHSPTTYAFSHACMLTDSPQLWKPRWMAGLIQTTLFAPNQLTYNSDIALGY